MCEVNITSWAANGQRATGSGQRAGAARSCTASTEGTDVAGQNPQNAKLKILGCDVLVSLSPGTKFLILCYLFPEAVWLNALKRVRRAVIHRAVEIKRMHVKRVHTELVDCVSAEEAAKFSMYLNMGKEGDYAISDRLQNAIEEAETTLDLVVKQRAGNEHNINNAGRPERHAHAAAPPPP